MTELDQLMDDFPESDDFPKSESKISIIYATARPDLPLVGMENVHQFKPLLDSLMGQTFNDFEVIIVDAIRGIRDFDFSEYRKHFTVKHIYLRDAPEQLRWAYDRGLWSLQGSFNFGLVHADGELLLWFGDCSCLPKDDILSSCWNWYQRGYFPQALAVYFIGYKPLMIKDLPIMYTDSVDAGTRLSKEDKKTMYDKMTDDYWKEIVKDSRWGFVESAGGIYYCSGQQFYGYGSNSLESMLRINGYDCSFVEKSLTDVEAGMRLERLGYKMVCDKNISIVERVHKGIERETLFGISDKAFINNYSLIMLNKTKNKNTANDYKLTNEELQWVIKDGVKYGISAVPGTHEYELLIDWCNMPTFNIRELRNERIKKGDKK